MYLRILILPAYIVLAASVMNYGCNSSSYKKEITNDSSSVKNYNPYFPAGTADKWEYINEAPRGDTELYKIGINGIKFEGDDRVVEFSSFPFFSKIEEKTVLRVKPNGKVYLINQSSGKDELFIPEPSKFKQGYTWKFGIWTGIVNSIYETVEAETGTYTDCVYLSFSIYYTFAAEVWLAKDIGIVKWGYFRTNPPTLIHTFYVLNKLSLAK